MLAITLAAALTGALAAPRNFTTIQPTGTFNPAAATAVQTHYPKDHHIVSGRVYDHMWHIVLDSADYDDAANNADLQYLASQGVLLDNYYALTHPPQANYLAIIGGDTFGLEEERFVSLPANVSTLVESLEAGKVLWAQYTEDQPFTAYDGWEYPAENPTYSRAKNPFVAYDSIMTEYKRYINLRSLETMEYDFADHKFPQWLFIRPNLNNDGTNSDLATAANWTRTFYDNWLTGKKSKWHRHWLLVTFANTASTTGPNHVWAVMLGDMNKDLHGTTDSTYYDHYSIAASTIANFDLPSLGRYDCSANVFGLINYKAHQDISSSPDIPDNYNAGPFSGYLSDDSVQLPVPNIKCDGRGHSGVLGRVRKVWKDASFGYYDWLVNY